MNKLKFFVRDILFSKPFRNLKIVKAMLAKREENMENKKREFFLKYAEESLLKVKEALDKNNITFWLDFGTLLGAVREKDFIKHDLDMDLGILYENDIDKKVEKALGEAEIKKIHEFTLDGQIVEQTYEYKGLTFDIFYYSKNEDIMWCYSFSPNEDKTRRIIEKDKTIIYGYDGIKLFVKTRGVEPIMFKGIEYNAPEDPNGYLVENYGKSYMIPNKDWNYMDDPTNRENLEDREIAMIRYN